VKEWCLNEGGGGRRYILGGGFGEPEYMFVDKDAQSPWDRKPNFGFRCVKMPSPPPAAAAKLEPAFRDYGKEKPVSDEVFRAYKGLYAYDKGELNARVEETLSAPDWTREKVSFNAAYGGERVIAYLYLPKNASPPYQTIVYFPGSSAIFQDKFNEAQSFMWDFVPKSGRALMYPVYKSTYERRDGLPGDTPEPTASGAITRSLGRRTSDGRSTILNREKTSTAGKLGYFGFSWGSAIAPILLAVDDRVRVAILGVGGLEFQKTLPEVDQINFVTAYEDARAPAERPLRFLLSGGVVAGSSLQASRDEREGQAPGHLRVRPHGSSKDLIRESLDWLDKYLGPVKR